MKKKIDFDKEIWEGWTVGDFIESLAPQLEMIMNSESFIKPFEDKASLKKWCIESFPYRKKNIPEVITYFAEKYKLK